MIDVAYVAITCCFMCVIICVPFLLIWYKEKKNTENLKSNIDEKSFDITSPEFLIKNVDSFFKIKNYFNDEIKRIVASELNKKIINDKMAQTSSMSVSEMFSEIKEIQEKIYAMFPVAYLNVINSLYTPEQIALVITDEVLDFSRSYYKIFEKGGKI